MRTAKVTGVKGQDMQSTDQPGTFDMYGMQLQGAEGGLVSEHLPTLRGGQHCVPAQE